MLDVIKTNPWLRSQIYFMDFHYVEQRQMKNYYLNLDPINTCILFIHGFLYDDKDFVKLIRRHHLIPTDNPRNFFFKESNLRSAFFAYAIFRCFGHKPLSDTITPVDAQCLMTFYMLLDQMSKKLEMPILDDLLKLSIFNSFIISSIEMEETTTYQTWLQLNVFNINQFDHKKMSSITMDYIFQNINFAKDQDCRWNESAIEFFKKKKFDDVVFVSHLLHHGEVQLETSGILAITNGMRADYHRQTAQKSEIVNNFLEKINRPEFIEHNVSKLHSKLHLIPNIMGKLQYLSCLKFPETYARIELYDDNVKAIFKWYLPIPVSHKFLAFDRLNKLFFKIRLYISPTEYGMGFLDDLNRSFMTKADITDLDKLLFELLKKIVYDDCLYNNTVALAKEWGWNCNCSQ